MIYVGAKACALEAVRWDGLIYVEEAGKNVWSHNLLSKIAYTRIKSNMDSRDRSLLRKMDSCRTDVPGAWSTRSIHERSWPEL